MRLSIIIACLFLAFNAYADETKGAGKENQQQAAQNAMPGWGSAEGYQSVDYDESGEPAYSDTDEPSFGEDDHTQG